MQQKNKAVKLILKISPVLLILYFVYRFITTFVFINLSFINKGSLAGINFQNMIFISLQGLLDLAVVIGLLRKQRWGQWLGIILVFLEVTTILKIALYDTVEILIGIDSTLLIISFLLLILLLFLTRKRYCGDKT